MRNLIESDAPMRYSLFETGLGTVGVAWSERGLTRLQLPESDAGATERRLRGRSSRATPGDPPAQVRQTIRRIEAYLGGDRTDFATIELDLTGISDVHRRIYDATRRVGWGETTTYGALARQSGMPDAARAVGQAMGSNPVPIIIPCHRVLAAGNKAGGFSAFGGRDTKYRLLALEGVHIGDTTPLLPGL
jgi:methylated-DNA-[protein]-cysteine S-methyltransferase